MSVPCTRKRSTSFRAASYSCGVALLVALAACGAKSDDARPNAEASEDTQAEPPENPDASLSNSNGAEPTSRDPTPTDDATNGAAESDDPSQESTGTSPDCGPACGGPTGEPSQPVGTTTEVGPSPSNPDLIDEQLASELEFLAGCDVDHLQSTSERCALGVTCNGQRSFTDCHFGDDYCSCRIDDVEQRIEAPDADDSSFCRSAMEYCATGLAESNSAAPTNCDVEVQQVDPSDVLCSTHEVCGTDVELPGALAARIVTRRAAVCVEGGEDQDVTLCSCGWFTPGPSSIETLLLELAPSHDTSQLCESLVVDYCSDLELEAAGDVSCTSEPLGGDCTFRTHCTQDARLSEQPVVVRSDMLGSCSTIDSNQDEAQWECSCTPALAPVVSEGLGTAGCEAAAQACVDALEAQPNLSKLPDVRAPLQPR